MKNKSIDSVKNIHLYDHHQLCNYDEVIWLIGEGRSGTTWISNLINHDKKYREMFEPFHPLKIEPMSFLSLHQYIRPNGINKELENIASDVFSGKFTHQRVDFNNTSLTSCKKLLIKDIFANLFAYWASLRFSWLKIILLIRNPFSVALSKYKKKDWLWLTDPIALLEQKKLYNDYLHPFENLIRKTCSKNDYILNQVLIWSIVNYVPLCQFNQGEIQVIFYEDVYLNPSQEISKLFNYSNNTSLIIDEKIIETPSRVPDTENNITNGISPIISWKNELSIQQIDFGFSILEAFGFETLYDNSSMPNKRALYRMITNNCISKNSRN